MQAWNKKETCWDGAWSDAVWELMQEEDGDDHLPPDSPVQSYLITSCIFLALSPPPTTDGDCGKAGRAGGGGGGTRRSDRLESHSRSSGHASGMPFVARRSSLAAAVAVVAVAGRARERRIG